ncbi:hypothetical protein [Nesterenkonia rhizosphaerae]
MSKDQRIAEAERSVDVNRSTPEERYDTTMAFTLGLGFPMAVGVVAMIIIGYTTHDYVLIIKATIGSHIFFVLWIILLLPRTFAIEIDRHRWRRLQREGRIGEYAPGRAARMAIPRDHDVIVPLITTIALTAFILTSGMVEEFVIWMDNQ